MSAPTIEVEPVETETAEVETPAVKPVIITAPGIYDIPEDVYHRDPVPFGSLSSTGARALLAPSCPALFDYERHHPAPPKEEFDLGSAVHTLVLGSGAGLHLVDATSWRTNAAKDEAKSARAEGKIPLLPDDWAKVHEMADALWAQPHAAREFDPDGLPEQSLFWIDPEFEVWCRARPDWLTPAQITDLKTSTSADVNHIARQVLNLAYYQQAAHYLDGAIELDLIDPDAPFRFVVQSKTPPYLATVAELDEDSIDAGRARNRKALEIFRDCSQSGFWPGHSTEVELISIPPWAIRRDLEGNF